MQAPEAFKDLAIRNFLFSRTMPILLEKKGKDTARVIGTAMPFSARGRHFLVSADHVLRHATKPGETLGVPLRKEAGEVLTLTGQLTRAPANPIDLAVMEISESLAADLTVGWSFVGSYAVCPYRPRFDCYFTVGFPGKFSRSHGVLVIGNPMGIIGSDFSGPVACNAEPFDPNIDLLIEFPDLDYHSGEPLKAPRIGGMSGAPVWAILPDTTPEAGVWDPTNQAKLVGTITEACHKRYVRARQWHLVYRIFERLDSEIASEIRRALSPRRPG